MKDIFKALLFALGVLVISLALLDATQTPLPDRGISYIILSLFIGGVLVRMGLR